MIVSTKFQTLHHRQGAPVVLANVWDAATARVAVAAGFEAVATSSFALAEALGYGDHEQAPHEEMLAAAGKIVAAVAGEVPVTVDIESGYGVEPDLMVGRLVEIGAAGFNIEDTAYPTGELRPVSEQAALIARYRAALDKFEDPPLLNARVDSFIAPFLAGSGIDEDLLVEDAVERCRRYAAAGADCVFPIRVTRGDTARAIVSALDAPVNLLRMDPELSVPALAEMGCARVSLGPQLWWSFLSWFRGELDGVAAAAGLAPRAASA